MLVDSHCHLDMLGFEDQSLDDYLQAAAASDVQHMLCVAVSLERFQSMYDTVADYSQVSLSVGVHPDGEDVHDPQAEELVALAADERVVAIGETGLDYFRLEGDLEWQRERFRQHIRASRASAKPLIIHTRAARDDTLAIMREEGASEAGGVMHCFTEDWDMAKQAMDMNFYVSFSGIVTFKNATELKEVARKMPADRLLVETDSPYLAPVPKRGQQNQPAYVRYVAEYLAELRGESLDQLAATTTDNFYRLFSAAPRSRSV